MSIETTCTGCGQRLRVADEHAGKMAKCPKCQTTYMVPGPQHLSDTTAPDYAPSAARSEPIRPGEGPVETGSEPEDAQSDQWYVLAADERSYGPVSKRELDTWFAEGRIGAQTKLRQGTGSWLSASSIYPSLVAVNKEQLGPAPGLNPFAEQTGTDQPPIAPTTPARYYQPHRAGMILTLGILGLCCNLLGPIAWAMGNADLNEMSAGRMDPTGRSNTQAGMILGIIGTGLLVLGVLSQVLTLVFGGFMN